jgi:tight adherence protein B
MFFFAPLILFSVALFAVAHYVWVIPQREAERALEMRLRGARSAQRDKRGAADLMRRERRGVLTFLSDFLGWIQLAQRLQVHIDQANLTWRAADVVGICGACALAAYVVFDFLIPILPLRLAAALAMGALPIVWIERKRAARLAKFELQLADSIDLFTRSMRAGHNIHSGLETIAAESSEPVRMEFRKLVEELALGSQIEPALHALSERVPVLDLRFFVTGLILQRQTGANMVEVLENLSLLVRERLNISAKLKAHTAQQRFSAALLCGVPFVMALGLWVLKPEYIHLLWEDPVGNKFLTYAVISECIGILVIRKMANIKF